MPTQIIVGVDGSAHAWRALDWAADYAVRHGRPLELVHASRALVDDGVIPKDALGRLVAEREDLLAEARQYALKVHPGLDVATRLDRTDPGGALVEGSEHAALVAVGSRGLGGFEGLLFGSVGLYTAAHARCPVLVVPREAPYPAEAPARIVVGVEDRPGESAMAGWAFEEAASRGAGILALHAVGGEFGSPRRRVMEDLELSEALAGLGEHHPDVRVEQLVSDRAVADALVEASRTAALVVVGAARRTGRIGMALGRVNHAVLHHAHCPVVVVPIDR
ncbi:nucleotide-binding universal stress UspA family protein [Actinomadura coerulea]|uniref:Nucleotide-binding universal stress UspA family protein n=1 Tax=Actinomadura coerulea TaxID=46159 RepID=A0A7X0FUS7_9ACTN|nr:universal stress protein [Actinomadura coerulea]MBB6394093.1 nucleotide-binding universal stress UspA family protein [Actinomadura coerulea]GGQ20249.1 universal stress protein [Actinomadura coerulea]